MRPPGAHTGPRRSYFVTHFSQLRLGSRGAIPEEKALSPLTKLEKPKTTSDTKSENPLVFLPKTENRMLKQSKTANRNRHKNRKTEGNGCKNRKTDLKNGQNRKTENPNAPLVKDYRDSREDRQIISQVVFKPIIDTQKATKETVDQKQDKLIKQIQNNQLALRQGLKKVEDLNRDFLSLPPTNYHR